MFDFLFEIEDLVSSSDDSHIIFSKIVWYLVSAAGFRLDIFSEKFGHGIFAILCSNTNTDGRRGHSVFWVAMLFPRRISKKLWQDDCAVLGHSRFRNEPCRIKSMQLTFFFEFKQPPFRFYSTDEVRTEDAAQLESIQNVVFYTHNEV